MTTENVCRAAKCPSGVNLPLTLFLLRTTGVEGSKKEEEGALRILMYKIHLHRNTQRLRRKSVLIKEWHAEFLFICFPCFHFTWCGCSGLTDSEQVVLHFS